MSFSQPSNGPLSGGSLPGAPLSALGIVNAVMQRGRSRLGAFPNFAGNAAAMTRLGGGSVAVKGKQDKQDQAPKQQQGGYDPSYDTYTMQGRAVPIGGSSQKSAPTPTPDQATGGAGDAQKAQDQKDDSESDAQDSATQQQNAPDPIAQQIQNAGEQQGAIPSDTFDPAAGTGGEGDIYSEPGYAEGGAIPDGPEYDENQSTPPIQVASSQPDDSGAVPVAGAPDDNSGALPVAAAQAAPQQPQQGVGVPTGDSQLPIMAYLHGAGAAAKDYVMRVAQSITPGMNQAFGAAGDGAIPENPAQTQVSAPTPPEVNGRLTVPAENVVAAAEQKDGKGFETAQYLRQRFTPALAMSSEALKQGHRENAADLATQAYTWVPGTRASFQATPQGFIADINDANSGKTVRYNLDDKAFSELTHLASASQFDSLIAKGGLSKTAAQLAGQAPPQGKTQPKAQGDEDEAPQQTAPSAKQRSKVVTILPGPNSGPNARPTYQLIGGAAAQPPSANDSVETRAQRRAMGGPGEQAQQDYMDKESQFEAGLKNKKDVAKQQGENAANIARIRGAVALKTNENTVAGRLKANENTNFNRQQIAAMNSADRQALLQFKINQAHELAIRGDLSNARAALDTAVVAGGGVKSLSPEHQAMFNSVVSRLNNPGAYAQQGAPAPQQRPAQAAAPQPAATQKPAPQQNNRAALEAEMRRRGLLQ
jgi:hypothetical protein